MRRHAELYEETELYDEAELQKKSSADDPLDSTIEQRRCKTRSSHEPILVRGPILATGPINFWTFHVEVPWSSDQYWSYDWNESNEYIIDWL